MTTDKLLFLELHTLNLKYKFIKQFKIEHHELLQELQTKMNNDVALPIIKKWLFRHISIIYNEYIKPFIITLSEDIQTLYSLPATSYKIDKTLMMGYNLDEVIVSRINSHFKRLVSQVITNDLKINDVKRKELNATISTTTDYIKVVKSNATEEIEAGFNNIKGWIYSSILDRRTSGLCLSLNNKFYPATKYKMRSALPYVPNVNTHPHCRSILITIFKNDDIIKYKNMNLNEFLLHEDDQYEVKKLLGNKKYELFKEHKLNVNDIFDYRKRGFKTIKQIKEDLNIS